jgi:preprotein translocase subunit YajC
VLDFLVSPAHAQAAASQGDPFMSFLPLIILLVLFWFMLIRPQM